MNVDRSLDRAFPVLLRHDGTVGTLRASHELVWLIVWGHDGYAKISRCLHPVERFALQGFPPELAAGLSKCQCLEWPGNSFSVPAMASAMAQCLRGLVGVLPARSIPVSLTAHGNDVEAETHRHMVALQRRGVALIERLYHIYADLVAAARPA